MSFYRRETLEPSFFFFFFVVVLLSSSFFLSFFLSSFLPFSFLSLFFLFSFFGFHVLLGFVCVCVVFVVLVVVCLWLCFVCAGCVSPPPPPSPLFFSLPPLLLLLLFLDSFVPCRSRPSSPALVFFLLSPCPPFLASSFSLFSLPLLLLPVFIAPPCPLSRLFVLFRLLPFLVVSVCVFCLWLCFVFLCGAGCVCPPPPPPPLLSLPLLLLLLLLDSSLSFVLSLPVSCSRLLSLSPFCPLSRSSLLVPSASSSASSFSAFHLQSLFSV